MRTMDSINETITKIQTQLMEAQAVKKTARRNEAFMKSQKVLKLSQFG